MEIIEKPIADLIPYENNPRHNKNAIDKVAASINEFGWKQPVIIDRDNVIIAGHTRLKAAEKLGLKTVPCIVADDLNEEAVRAFRLADNKTAELASWNFELLDVELERLGEIDLDSLGFYIPQADEFGENFTLPDGEKETIVFKFTFHIEQWETLSAAFEELGEDPEDEVGRAKAAAIICEDILNA